MDIYINRMIYENINATICHSALLAQEKTNNILWDSFFPPYLGTQFISFKVLHGFVIAFFH